MRILKLLALLLTTPLLLIAALLAKTHWEIRQIDPTLPTAETLQATLNSADSPIKLGYILNAVQPGPGGHTGGSQAICEATTGSITLFQSPWQAERSNYTTRPGVEDLHRASCFNHQLLSELQLSSMPGFPGLVAISAGGHTPGSTIYAAKVNGTTWLLAGDISNEKAALLSNRPKPAWYRWLITPEAEGRLEEVRLWLAELDAQTEYQVVVSHDLLALEESGMPRLARHAAEVNSQGEAE